MSDGRKMFIAFVAISVLALLVVGALIGPGGVGMAEAAAPTPISGFYYNADNVKKDVNFFVADVITSDTASTAFELANYELMDVQYIIDQTAVNTATLKLQFSNDNSNWVDGISIVASNAADASALQPFQTFGEYARVYADVSNSNPVTISVLAVAK